MGILSRDACLLQQKKENFVFYEVRLNATWGPEFLISRNGNAAPSQSGDWAVTGATDHFREPMISRIYFNLRALDIWTVTSIDDIFDLLKFVGSLLTNLSHTRVSFRSLS